MPLLQQQAGNTIIYNEQELLRQIRQGEIEKLNLGDYKSVNTEELAPMQLPMPNFSPPFAFLQDGVFAAAEGNNIRLIKPKDEKSRLLSGRHDTPITHLATLRDGRLASRSEDGKIFIWPTKEVTQSKTITGPSVAEAPVFALVPASENTPDYLIFGHSTGHIEIIAAASGARFTIPTCLDNDVGISCLTPLGNDQYASGSADGTIYLWAGMGGKKGELQGHIFPITALCPLPNGLLASSAKNIKKDNAKDCSIKIWNRETGECLHTLTGHSAEISTLLVSNGLLASESLDGSIRIWSLETGICLRTFESTSWEENSKLKNLVALPYEQLAWINNEGTVTIYNTLTDNANSFVPASSSQDSFSLIAHPDGYLIKASINTRSTTFTSWRLQLQSLNDKELISIFNVLNEPTSRVTHLSLKNTSLNQTEFIYLGKFIKTNYHLKFLDISEAKIADHNFYMDEYKISGKYTNFLKSILQRKLEISCSLEIKYPEGHEPKNIHVTALMKETIGGVKQELILWEDISISLSQAINAKSVKLLDETLSKIANRPDIWIKILNSQPLSTWIYMFIKKGFFDHIESFLTAVTAALYISFNLEEMILFAVYNRSLSMLQYVLNRDLQKIDLPVDNAGNTLLHISAAKGFENIVAFLLEKGAKFNIKNHHCLKPKDLAELSGHQAIVMRLMKEKPNKQPKISRPINFNHDEAGPSSRSPIPQRSQASKPSKDLLTQIQEGKITEFNLGHFLQEARWKPGSTINLPNWSPRSRDIFIYLPNGSLVRSLENGDINLIDTCTGEVKILKGHKTPVVRMQIVNNSNFVSLDAEGIVHIWSKNGDCLKTQNLGLEHALYLATSPEGQIMVGTIGGEAAIWFPNETDANESVYYFPSDTLIRSFVYLTEELVAFGSLKGRITVYDVTQKKEVRTFYKEEFLTAITQLINLPGGRLLSSSNNDTTHIWDYNSGACLQTLESSDQVADFTSAKDKLLLKTYSDAKLFKIWDTETGNCIKTGKIYRFAYGSITNHIVVFPNNRIAWVSSLGDIRLWDAASDSTFILSPNGEEPYPPRLVASNNGYLAAVLKSEKGQAYIKTWQTVSAKPSAEKLKSILEALTAPTSKVTHISTNGIPIGEGIFELLRTLIKTNLTLSYLDIQEMSLSSIHKAILFREQLSRILITGSLIVTDNLQAEAGEHFYNSNYGLLLKMSMDETTILLREKLNKINNPLLWNIAPQIMENIRGILNFIQSLERNIKNFDKYKLKHLLRNIQKISSGISHSENILAAIWASVLLHRSLFDWIILFLAPQLKTSLSYFTRKLQETWDITISANMAAQYAVNKGSLVLLKFALDKKANLNSPIDTVGHTLLHVAAAKGHDDLVFELLERGAKFNAKNTQGLKPWQLAEQAGHLSVVEILKNEKPEFKLFQGYHKGKGALVAPPVDANDSNDASSSSSAVETKTLSL